MFMLLPTTAPACLVSYDESSEDSEFYEDMVTDGDWNKKMRIWSSRPGGQFINVELPLAAAIGAATDVPVASISGAGLPTAPSSDVSVSDGLLFWVSFEHSTLTFLGFMVWGFEFGVST
jgi:hypothetical protein